MDSDGEILARVLKSKNFFHSVLYEDRLDDWNVAKDLGEFLIRINPEEIMGHALVARASRHLGDLQRALEELEHCRVRTMHPSETDLFLSFLAHEEKLLSGQPGKGGSSG